MDLQRAVQESPSCGTRAEPHAGAGVSAELSAIPPADPAVVPPPPKPLERMAKWYNNGGSPLWLAGSRRHGAPVGRLVSLDVPREVPLERFVSLLERAPDIREVALAQLSGSPFLEEVRKASITGGDWHVTIRSVEPNEDQAARVYIKAEIRFQPKEKWGEASHDATLMRFLPFLVEALGQDVEQGQGAAPARKLLAEIRMREDFLRKFGFVAPLPELNESNQKLMLRGHYEELGTDSRSEVDGRPMVLTFVPRLGTCLVPAVFTNDYLEARAEAVEFAWILTQRSSRRPAGDDSASWALTAHAYDRASHQAGLIGLPDLEERLAEVAEAVNQQAQ